MKNRLRIATWNLKSVESLTSEKEGVFRQSMNNIDADVWILTETWTTLLPHDDYSIVAQSSSAVDLKDSDNRCWVTIWSKVGGKQLDVQRQADRMTCVRIPLTGEKSLMVFGTVLPWRSDKLWPGAVGFCTALDEQAGEWERLRKIHPNDRVLIAGDFNQAINNTHYGTKQGSQALEDAMRIQGLSCLTKGKNPLSGEPSIDHILVGPGHDETDSDLESGTWPIPKVKNKPVTDHFGVYADLGVLQ